MNYIDLELLSNFMVVVKTMNITTAASMLYMAQPTLSRQIKVLEKQLGADLFVHSKKAFQLTPAGHILYQDGQELLSIAGSLMERIQAVADDVDKKLIVETSLLEHRKLRECYTTFRKKHPMVNCSIINRRSYQIIDDIISGNVDVGLITSATAEEYPNKLEKIDSMKIGSDKLAVLVGKNHRYARQGSCTFDELRDEKNDIMYSASAGGFTSGGNYKFFSRIAELERLKFSVIEETTWETLLYDLTFQDRAVLCLKSFEDYCGKDFAVVEICGSVYDCDHLLIWNKQGVKSVTKKFLSLFDRAEI